MLFYFYCFILYPLCHVSICFHLCSLYEFNHQGGDKLTLNLTGNSVPLNVLSPSHHNNNNNSLTSTPTARSFPSTPDSSTFSTSFASLMHNTPLTPTQVSSTDGPTSLLNGNAETVTVTHYSEQRGAMEKISVPSLNIFNAEIKTTDQPDNNNYRSPGMAKKQTNNPFLNMSPPAQALAAACAVSSTNPFNSPTSTFSVAQANNHSNGSSSMNNNNNNPFTDTELDNSSSNNSSRQLSSPPQSSIPAVVEYSKVMMF